jgi:hypothetical protein
MLFSGCADDNDDSSGYGHFIGNLDLRADRNGRDMMLLSDFGYVDSAGKTWNTPKNTIVDGASIPQAAWSIIGSPWTGKYREASVIHDYYCVTKSEPWEAVHRTFYTAMRANNVDEIQAKVMYAAVYRFGPRWRFEYTPECKNCLALPYFVENYVPKFNSQEFEALKQEIQASDPSLKEIEAKANTQFENEIKNIEIGSPILIN